MLEQTLETTYRPGTVLQGEVSGAAWTYLLPSLELDRTVCLGCPPARTLKTLARISRDVVILCRTGNELIRARQVASACRRDNVHVRQVVVPDVLPVESQSVDLVYAAVGWSGEQLRRDPETAREIERILKPAGLIYHERRRLPGGKGAAGSAAVYRLSPVIGEVRTAVPAEAEGAQAFYHRRRLERPVLTLSLLKSLWRRLRRKSVVAETPVRNTHRQISESIRPPRLPGFVRRMGHRLIEKLQGLEQVWRGGSASAGVLQRYGVLTRAGEDRLENGPPEYLCRLAAKCGVDLTGWTFGMTADGEFQSRKTLFYLFPEDARAPQTIVKISRDPDFNDRVVRERRALERLAALPGEVSGAVPKVSFYGTHNRLAVLGQTAFDARPFAEQSERTVSCRFMQKAVDWIGDLGRTTVERPKEPATAAAALERLQERFCELYRPEERMQWFLAEQMEQLRQVTADCPSVFLHGDVHTTNLLVTGSGEIAIVDWEASDPRGMPLWDLFFFLRAHLMLCTGTRNSAEQVQIFGRAFLQGSDWNDLIQKAVADYCTKLELSSAVIEPLFYTCWMHRALREAWRLTPEQLQRGQYYQLLKHCIDHRGSAGLQRLFAAGATAETDTTAVPVLIHSI